MLEFTEYLKVFKEEDAPALGASPVGATPPIGGDAPALGAPPMGATPPIGGDASGLTAPSVGATPPMGSPPDATGGFAAGGGTGDAKTADINLKDAFYYLKKYFD